MLSVSTAMVKKKWLKSAFLQKARSICGYTIEEIGHALTRQLRYRDKLADELAKDRPMAKILRGS